MTTTASRFRKKPIEIEAVQWTGDNQAALSLFAAARIDRARGITEATIRFTGNGTGQVYDELHSTWVNFALGDWILRGVRGEFYPCARDVFAETYDSVEPVEETCP